MLNAVADRIDANLETLALVEAMDNGKPIREARAADVPLAADHFRYFAACLRAEEGSFTELDSETVAYHFREPYGVVGQIIPWTFPLLMAAWKLGPALGAGNCVVLKPASETPLSVMVLMNLVADVPPPGVLNVVNGKGTEIDKNLLVSYSPNAMGFFQRRRARARRVYACSAGRSAQAEGGARRADLPSVRRLL